MLNINEHSGFQSKKLLKEESGEGDEEVLFQPSCSRCQERKSKCVARRTTRGHRWTSCSKCKKGKQGCSALAIFPSIVVRQGQVMHATSSWHDVVQLTTVLGGETDQVSVPVDLNVQMASPPKVAPKPVTQRPPPIILRLPPKMLKDNDNANNDADNNDGSDKANDSKELPSAVSKGKLHRPGKHRPLSPTPHQWSPRLHQPAEPAICANGPAVEPGSQGPQGTGGQPLKSKTGKLAKRTLGSLENPLATFNHYINQNATLGGFCGIPDSVLGGLAGPSYYM
ncbi:hypothetical protein BS17DRAFT_764168 [Gyrodon lividus]|nr:hypothetical protein BS17DRAFT_764168 [Gyrodon lividus]